MIYWILFYFILHLAHKIILFFNWNIPFASISTLLRVVAAPISPLLTPQLRHSFAVAHICYIIPSSTIYCYWLRLFCFVFIRKFYLSYHWRQSGRGGQAWKLKPSVIGCCVSSGTRRVLCVLVIFQELAWKIYNTQLLFWEHEFCQIKSVRKQAPVGNGKEMKR